MIKVHNVENKAIAIIFETEDEIDFKMFTLDEAEDLIFQLETTMQDLKVSRYVEESTEGEQP